MHVQHLPLSSLERGWRRVLAHVSVTSKPTALHKAVLLAPGLRDAPILNLQMSASGVGHPKTIGDVCRSACISCPWHRCSCLLVTLAFKRESQASPLLPPKKSCFYIHDEQRSLQKCSPKSCFRENYAGLEEKFPLARPGGESSKGASAASAVGGAAAARAIGPTGVPSPAEGAAFPPPPPFMPAVPGGGNMHPQTRAGAEPLLFARVSVSKWEAPLPVFWWCPWNVFSIKWWKGQRFWLDPRWDILYFSLPSPTPGCPRSPRQWQQHWKVWRAAACTYSPESNALHPREEITSPLPGGDFWSSPEHWETATVSQGVFKCPFRMFHYALFSLFTFKGWTQPPANSTEELRCFFCFPDSW